LFVKRNSRDRYSCGSQRGVFLMRVKFISRLVSIFPGLRECGKGLS